MLSLYKLFILYKTNQTKYFELVDHKLTFILVGLYIYTELWSLSPQKDRKFTQFHEKISINLGPRR